jgi:hypothetical protein
MVEIDEDEARLNAALRKARHRLAQDGVVLHADGVPPDMHAPAGERLYLLVDESAVVGTPARLCVKFATPE